MTGFEKEVARIRASKKAKFKSLIQSAKFSPDMYRPNKSNKKFSNFKIGKVIRGE